MTKDIASTLDTDMLYPLPSKAGALTHKLPADFNRRERRAIDAIVDRCERAGIAHPYVARMTD
jgi:hypothetical protein